MDREKAYTLLARELARFRRLPRPDLVRCIGGPTIERTEWDGAEPLTIEIRVEWADAEAGTIRIRATSNGPSCWRLERLEEAVLVRAAEPSNALSPAERLELIGQIWDSIADSDEPITIPESHLREIESRLASADANPDAAVPWEEVKARLSDRS